VANSFLLIRPSQPLTQLPADGAMQLAVAQKYVDGYIEIHYVESPHQNGRRLVLMFNEEGTLQGMPPCVVYEPVGTLVGPVVIGAEEDGEFLPLTDAEQARILLVKASGAVPILRISPP
jgi:hypothetical protein